jgi:hypothetical protein
VLARERRLGGEGARGGEHDGQGEGRESHEASCFLDEIGTIRNA